MRAISSGLGVMLAVAAIASPSGQALSQAASPAGNGGGVGASVAEPRTPAGTAPPGTPSGAADPAARDAASKGVVGATATPDSSVAGNTGGADSGVRK